MDLLRRTKKSKKKKKDKDDRTEEDGEGSQKPSTSAFSNLMTPKSPELNNGGQSRTTSLGQRKQSGGGQREVSSSPRKKPPGGGSLYPTVDAVRGHSVKMQYPALKITDSEEEDDDDLTPSTAGIRKDKKKPKRNIGLGPVVEEKEESAAFSTKLKPREPSFASFPGDTPVTKMKPTTSAPQPSSSSSRPTDTNATGSFSFGRPSKRSVSLEDDTPGPTEEQKQTSSSSAGNVSAVEQMTAAVAAASSSSLPPSTTNTNINPTGLYGTTSGSSLLSEGGSSPQNRSGNRRPILDDDDIKAMAKDQSEDGEESGEESEDSEDSDLRRALAESESMAAAANNNSGSGGRAASSSQITEEQRETFQSNARSLRTLCDQTDADTSLMDFLTQQCEEDQKIISEQIQQLAASADDLDVLSDLIQLNETVLGAIDMSKRHKSRKKPSRDSRSSSSRRETSAPSTRNESMNSSSPATSVVLEMPKQPQLAQVSSSMDIGALVRKQDIFSLICMLRSQNSEQRLDAAMALMRFARDVDDTKPEEVRLRDEIHSSGGLHSLLTLFLRSSNPSVKLISALAVAYVLPASVVASGQNIKPQVGLKLVECLRFLTTIQSTQRIREDEITSHDCCRAASLGLTAFWIHTLEPMLRSLLPEERLLVNGNQLGSQYSLNANDDKDAIPPAALARRASSAGGSMVSRQRFRTFTSQRREASGIQELLEMSITLVIRFASFFESESSSTGKNQSPLLSDMTADAVLLVEQVCALEVARPIAVREGILRVLVEWIRGSPALAGNKMKQAAVLSLRHLTSIKDKYMAGWIHSQMVSSGALPAIVALTNDIHLAYPARLAVAQILSSLCIAPHTRAAVVEANCIHFLIDLLYEHAESDELATFAGQALFQLAAGAIQRAGTMGASDKELLGFSSRERHDRILNDIVARGAIASFVAIALEKRGKLRMIAIETLGVLSEDVNPKRGTRLQLCEDGTALALGETMIDCLRRGHEEDGPLVGSKCGDEDLEQLFQALCTLSNILDPTYEGTLSRSSTMADVGDAPRPKSLLIKSCMQTIESGGLKSMLRLAALPSVDTRVVPLVEESCHSLSLLSPYLLSSEIASNGLAGWAEQVLDVFCFIVENLSTENGDSEDFGDNMDLHVSVLQGIGALAKSAPLKTRIVDRILPYLIRARNSRDGTLVSNSASQAFQSLEFAEDEVAVQTAGNNANLVCDWFCMQRSFFIQAMARGEIRQHLSETWGEALAHSNDVGVTKLSRKVSDRSKVSSDSLSSELPRFGSDDPSEKEIESIVKQFESMFGASAASAMSQVTPLAPRASKTSDDGLLSQQVYPLESSQSETAWILNHARALNDDTDFNGLSGHVEELLDRCFPSPLLRERVIPTQVVKLDSPYDFRAILMPQRRYFSFRREGLLLSRLCDKESAALSDPSEAHWTLNFTNSSFAGEFAESLVQALYMCPTICGLSFVGNNAAGSGEGDSGLERTPSMQAKPGGGEGGGLLANLVGSLPPWIGNLTFERVLNDGDMKALVAVLETLGRLTGGRGLLSQSFVASRVHTFSATKPEEQAQGRFSFFAVRHSPELSSVAWKSFFHLIGEPRRSHLNEKRPLSTLRSLDLSGNGLGDDLSAIVLEIVHEKTSGCQIEEIDLSGNRIGAGAQVLSVLSTYAQTHRSSKLSGVKVRGGIWKAPLHTLRLSMNGLSKGTAWLEIVAMLKRDTLELKALDLSSNKLALKEDDYDSDIIVSSLLKSSSLQVLNLSGNEFHTRTIDDMLGQLANSSNDKGLALVHLSNNTPPLNDRQLQQLDELSQNSRSTMIQRMNAEKEASQQTMDQVGSVRFGHSIRPMAIDEGAESYREANEDQQVSIPEEASADNKITVLFSAPLVFKDGSETLRPFAKLDFEMERELLWQCLKEASRDIELSFDSATHDRLLATVSKRCSCLHYSGHGNEHYLPFEDGKGGPNWFEVEDIKKLIGAQHGSVPFRFVFVSACFSGLAGETFAAAGVPHVVCCRQEFELKDAAALAFTRQFYLALAVGHTVQESFELGCKAVRATPNLRDAEREMEKFILLPKDGNHNVPIFDAKPVLHWPRSLHGSGNRSKAKVAGNARSGELGVRNMIQEDPSPSPPQFFLGREVDMYIVLNLLLVKRLVSVVGDVGVGRSSLVCALCHYINERKTTMNQIKHIYFVKVKQRNPNQNRVRALVHRLLKKLVEAELVSMEDFNKNSDIEALFDVICKSLKNEKALIVFDRTDLLEDSDEGNEFPMLLSVLFRETRNVRVLLTARETLGIPSIGGHVEHYYRLGPLTFANSVRLFASLCPYMHTPADRKRLFNKMVANMDEAELLPTDPGISSTVRKQFELIGNGIPSNIEKAAFTISKDVLMSLLSGVSH